MGDAHTLGYSVARQAPNGIVHLLVTMTRPCLHLAMNEAWILDHDAGQGLDDADLRATTATAIRAVREYRDHDPDGRLKAVWHAGVGNDGRYLLHGRERWFHDNGALMRDAQYQLGRMIGHERFYRPHGALAWEWEHRPDGTSTWTQRWENGGLKPASTWRDFHAEGLARTWDRHGNPLHEKRFPQNP